MTDGLTVAGNEFLTKLLHSASGIVGSERPGWRMQHERQWLDIEHESFIHDPR
jgi:hypothetical protein